MRILREFKRDLLCTDLRICLLSALLAWVLCGLSLWLAGGTIRYRELCGLCSAPPPLLWICLRQCSALVFGFALGIIIGTPSCCSSGWRKQGTLWWIAGFVATLLWQFVFLGIGSELGTLFLLTGAILCFLAALLPFARESLLSALLLSIGILWMIGSFGLILTIILWN